MVRSVSVQVRYRKDQYDQLVANAKARGFAFLSGYIRFMTLHQDFALLRRVHEIHEHLLGRPRKKPTRDEPRHF